MGKTYPKLNQKSRGFVDDDYIIFYYPSSDGINIARVVSGYRDLEDLF
jgi:toxin ParE1/3/4